MEKLKVLIVDDEFGILAGIRKVLQNFTVSFPFHDDDFEYDLKEAMTGEEALEIINQEAIDIILLDNKLPGIEGIEVLEYVKRERFDMAVIMITSYASIELAVKATNSGAFNFVPKPFTAQELKTAVESVTKHLFLKRMTKKMTDDAKEIRFRFLSVLSHELKSPINTVESYLQIMKDKQLGDEINLYEKMIDRSIARIDGMRGLILDMLDFTRVESGKKKRELKQLNVIELAHMSLDSIRLECRRKNIELKINLANEIKFLGDAGEIEIIFNNLLSNAVKYNNDNGKIEFSVFVDEECMTIRVSDTGIGMTEEEKSNLFKEFMRAKNENTRNIAGSGLGLSIVKKIVDLNKGSIQVETVFEKGSSFTLRLPHLDK